MSHERFDNEDELRRAVIRDLDAGPIPPAGAGQARRRVRVAGLPFLRIVPRRRARALRRRRQPVKRRSAEPAHGKRKGARVARRGAMVAVAAVLVVLLSGVAFAASRLVQMQPGDVEISGAVTTCPFTTACSPGFPA